MRKSSKERGRRKENREEKDDGFLSRCSVRYTLVPMTTEREPSDRRGEDSKERERERDFRLTVEPLVEPLREKARMKCRSRSCYFLFFLRGKKSQVIVRKRLASISRDSWSFCAREMICVHGLSV